MFVNPGLTVPLILFAGLLGAPTAWAQGSAHGHMSSDWTKLKYDPIAMAKGSEAMYGRFKEVALKATLDIRCPLPSDPKGYGTGRLTMMSYFWSPKKFQVDYLIYDEKPPAGVPGNNFLLSDGTKTRVRGPGAKANAEFDRKSALFNSPSDAALVESWPATFPRYMFSWFASGNATLSRYVAALSKGVGGYKVSTWARDLRVQGGRFIRQYRIYAIRGKHGNTPRSSVEIIFSPAEVTESNWYFLPTTIETTLGPEDSPKYHLKWSGGWLNHAKMPASPWDVFMSNG